MKTSIKITISIAALLVVLVAIFFAAPYTDYKKAKAEGKLGFDNPFDPNSAPPSYLSRYVNTLLPISKVSERNYLQCCVLWWKTKFQSETIDGGTLPEITVTAPKA